MPLLTMLEQLNLLVLRNNATSYNTIKNKLRLIRNDINGTEPKDIKYASLQLITSYVTSGYAPISARLVQAALFNTSPLADVAKLLGCEYAHDEQRAVVETDNNKTLIVFIGGVSFVEVSAIRLLKKLDPSVECVVLTTNFLEGDAIIKELTNLFKLEKEEVQEHEKLQEIIEEMNKTEEESSVCLDHISVYK